MAVAGPACGSSVAASEAGTAPVPLGGEPKTPLAASLGSAASRAPSTGQSAPKAGTTGPAP